LIISANRTRHDVLGAYCGSKDEKKEAMLRQDTFDLKSTIVSVEYVDIRFFMESLQ
jgi:hypothetical protein